MQPAMMTEKKGGKSQNKIWRKSGNFTVKQEGDSMKELLDNIKKIFSKKLTLAVVLVIVAALAIVGLCTWYHFSIEPLGNGYAAYAFWR